MVVVVLVVEASLPVVVSVVAERLPEATAVLVVKHPTEPAAEFFLFFDRKMYMGLVVHMDL